jgi:hypothetical protein
MVLSKIINDTEQNRLLDQVKESMFTTHVNSICLQETMPLVFY